VAPPVLIPVLEHPLMDDALRMAELYPRYLVNSIGQKDDLRRLVDVVTTQMEIEKRVEAALVLDGVNPATLLEKRHQVRGFLFYPRGTSLSPATYHRHLNNMSLNGTRLSLPYQRVLRAVRSHDLLL